MNISTTQDTLFPTSMRNARSLVRTITPEGMTLEAEKTEEEKRLESSTFSVQKELTPEQKNRVLFLKNMLAQLLSMGDGQPTEEQKSRIREIEKEIAKITGVKIQSSLADATGTVPKKKETDEDEKKLQTVGIDPKEAEHALAEETGKSMNPGMQMLQKNAFFAQLGTLLDKNTGLFTISGK
ncbi:hypothetical protein [uncultured Pseudodesulfovibrio sp.]|uniref:hypothetical protein n=1 Tax=uncultured Pseudodesulfovibrio sp. TaxID=2035858 RepID=UPI0029C657CC|nr:hypothetical protein [uncultured Pseudodesulfovibrio sp.]